MREQPQATPTAVSAEYLAGIAEGRAFLRTNPGMTKEETRRHLENLRDLRRDFPASSPVGQMIRGELDFWTNKQRSAAPSRCA